MHEQRLTKTTAQQPMNVKNQSQTQTSHEQMLNMLWIHNRVAQYASSMPELVSHLRIQLAGVTQHAVRDSTRQAQSRHGQVGIQC